jgi:hypothetical protein
MGKICAKKGGLPTCHGVFDLPYEAYSASIHRNPSRQLADRKVIGRAVEKRTSFEQGNSL